MGFQPIQGDYFEKPTGLTAEDLLKWDGSALARLAKGSNGQFLGVNGSGNLAYANAGAELLHFIAGYSCFESIKVTSTSELSGTSTSYDNIETITLDNALDGKIVSGFGYKVLSCNYEAKKSTAGSTNLFLTTVAGGDHTTSLFDPYSSSITTSYTKFYRPLSATAKSLVNAYNTPLYLKYAVASGHTLYIQNREYHIGRTIPTGVFTLANESTISTIKHISLFDNGDSIKLNNDANFIFTGLSGQPTTPINSTTGYSFGVDIDYDDITQIEIVSGNPLIVFEKA